MENAMKIALVGRPSSGKWGRPETQKNPGETSRPTDIYGVLAELDIIRIY